MQRVALRPSVAACSIAILSCSVVARAQGVDPGFDPGADQTVWAVAVQPDGKIIVGGGFTHLGGVTGTTLRNHIGRLNADGTVDPSFDPGANSIVQAVAVQPDGKVLIGGNFTAVGGGNGLLAVRNHIARLNADGTVDTTFDPGANGNVYAFALQPDGKILVGGEFSTMGGGSPGTTRNRLARLNPNGAPDSWDPGASKPGGSAIVYTMALQGDGKVVVGGYFNGLGGGTGTMTTRNFIGRINPDGTVDTAFDPGATSISGVNALAIQADGKILVGGSFTGLGSALRSSIGRLNPDGTVDGFNPGAEAQVLTLGVQADGRILVGGYFKWLGGAGNPSIRSVRNYIGRINPDGSVDSGFDPGAGNVVNAVAVQPDGAMIAGGVFSTVGGGSGAATARLRIARFPATAAAVQTLTLTGGGSAPSVETWMRSGAGPEVSRVTFEFSFDGGFYSLLGSGARIAGGWQLTSVNLPTTRTVYLRARGYYGSGFQNGSGSIVESILVQAPTTPPTRHEGDFDGDGKADIAIYRPSTGTWYILNSSSGGSGYAWGVSTDVPVPGDYDGDGRTDIAVYRPSTAHWFILKSSTNYTTQNTYQWGSTGDMPVPADYDGDGRTDIAIYRPSNGTWYILKSSTGFTGGAVYAWGVSTDLPLPGDYDGDGTADLGLYRPSSGNWFILKSSTNYTGWDTYQFGTTGDIAVPGDYDGDGKTDIAVYRPSNGTWFLNRSSSGFATYAWGAANDIPIVGDFDGDGKADVTVYRPSSAHWFILKSGTNYTTQSTYQWGSTGDIPMLKRP